MWHALRGALWEALRDVGDRELRGWGLEREARGVRTGRDVVAIDCLELCVCARGSPRVCVYAPNNAGGVDDGTFMDTAEAFTCWKLPGLDLPAHLDVVTFKLF